MNFEFETKILKLTSDRRQILVDGEKLIKSERNKLDVEKYFDIDLLCSLDMRCQAIDILDRYKKQLIVEKNFYSEFHKSYIADIESLTENLPFIEREKVLDRCLPGLHENNSIRMQINENKWQACCKLARIIEIFDINKVNVRMFCEQISLANECDLSEVERLILEIDKHLDNQRYLAK